MNAVAKLKNVFLTRLKAWGPPMLQRFAWNREFAEGHWDFIDSTPDDCIYDFLARYAKKGAVLDLGCGSGNTGSELAGEHYSQYFGVDISDVAVEKARARAARLGRAEKNAYAQGDIAEFRPQGTFDVILFRESIWYIPLHKLSDVLARYRQHLKPDGIFLVRIYDRNLKADIVSLLRSSFTVVEERLLSEERGIILVLR